MSYAALLDATGEVNDLLNAGSVLRWDARTMMPAAGTATRGKQIATLAVAARDLLVSDRMRAALDGAEREVENEGEVARAVVAQVREAVRHHLAIPAALQARRAELGTLGQAVWQDARARADFAAFRPVLEETVALNREVAEAVGYRDHPYDALLHRFEPGETLVSLTALFARLKEALLPLVRAIGTRPQPRADFLERHYPEGRQAAFAAAMASVVGYDFGRGRLDTTVHPFEISFTREDVRITTRYREDYLPMSLFGALHEAGHGIYEQNVDPAYTRTPLATDLVGLYAVGGVSFGAHESQSRLFENRVGRSRAFWDAHFGRARDAFPEQLGDVSVEEFHRAVNRCRPSLVRVEADELTYDLHVMLRVELEAALVDGSLAIKDLPEAWNAKVKDYLGLDVPNDALGLLQDVHWSSGQIGAFCNYTIGNVMAAQLFAVAEAEPAVAAGLALGECGPLRAFMTEHVHRHGRLHPRDELLRRATGRALDPEPYVAELTRKYADLYGL